MAASISRWTHKCPSCGKVIRWRNVFCLTCAGQDKTRKRLRLSSAQSTVYKKHAGPSNRISGIPAQFAKLLVDGDEFKCLSCGKELKLQVKGPHGLRETRHRCYWKIARAFDTHYFRCFSCKKSKRISQFPVMFMHLASWTSTIQHGIFSRSKRKIKVRSVMCSECLHDREILVL